MTWGRFEAACRALWASDQTILIHDFVYQLSYKANKYRHQVFVFFILRKLDAFLYCECAPEQEIGTAFSLLAFSKVCRGDILDIKKTILLEHRSCNLCTVLDHVEHVLCLGEMLLAVCVIVSIPASSSQ